MLLLNQDNEKQALRAFNNAASIHKITIFDKVNGKSLLDYAKEYDPEGDFAKYFNNQSEHFFMQCLLCKKLDESKKYILDNKIKHNTIIEGDTFWNKIQIGDTEFLDLRQWFIPYLRLEVLLNLIVFGDLNKALDLLKKSSFYTILDTYDGKSILDYLKEHIPTFGKETNPLLLKYLENKKQNEVEALIEARGLHLTDEIDGVTLLLRLEQAGFLDVISALQTKEESDSNRTDLSPQLPINTTQLYREELQRINPNPEPEQDEDSTPVIGR